MPGGPSRLVSRVRGSDAARRGHDPRAKWVSDGGRASAPGGGGGPKRLRERGVSALPAWQGLRGNAPEGPPCALPAAGGGQPVAAPKSASEAWKDLYAWDDQGRDRWCGSSPSVVFTGQGLARSGLGRRGRDGAGARGLARALPPPPRGVWAAAALSPVHGAPRNPARLPALLPRVVLSHFPALFLPLAVGPPGSRRSFLLSWVSPFVLSSPAGLSLSPPPTRQSAPLAFF